MIPELGHLFLYFALALSLAQGVLPLVGAQKNQPGLMALARPLVHWQTLFIVAAFVLLAASFLRNDFSVQYVAQHSNSKLPTAYRAAAVWGGHEGSLLLWVLMLSLWTLAVARYSSKLPLPFVARILAVMGLVAAALLWLGLTGRASPVSRTIAIAL